MRIGDFDVGWSFDRFMEKEYVTGAIIIIANRTSGDDVVGI